MALKTPSQEHVTLAKAVGIGAVLYVVACLAGGGYGFAFFAIPIFMGFPIGISVPDRPYRASFIALGASLAILIITLREGIICLLFSLPVLLPGLLLGAFVGSVLNRQIKTRRGRNGSIALMALLGVGGQVYDGATCDASQHPIHFAQTARMIAATPDKVFATLTQRELRVAPRWPWFIRVGLPIPEAMIVEQPGVGGRVRFEFAQMTAFGRITAWQAPRELRYTIERYDLHDLPFHITRLGRAPDFGLRRERVAEWLSILDTHYTIEPAADGASRLTRQIVWQRHLAPDLYFGWLQQAVIERGQARLLELIEERVLSRELRKGRVVAVVDNLGQRDNAP